MQQDLTLLFYTANRIHESFAARIRAHLLALANGHIRIISVSQQPIPLGQNICVGPIGYSAWVCYQQILIGARMVETEFVACCEDDTLYTPDHFYYRPVENSFYYNKNRWILETHRGRTYFRWRNRTAMCGCIAPTRLMVQTLEERFAKFSEPITQTYDRRLVGWGEPGRYEGYLRLPKVKIDFFRSLQPIVTFNHKLGLGGLRKAHVEDKMEITLEPWGVAQHLWEHFYGTP